MSDWTRPEPFRDPYGDAMRKQQDRMEEARRAVLRCADALSALPALAEAMLAEQRITNDLLRKALDRLPPAAEP
jgi:hypothetical protein